MRQLVIVVALLGLMYLVTHTGEIQGIEPPFDTQTLIATGFILLAAYAFGELFRRLRLPALLGYLAAGVLFGPSFAAIVYEHIQPAPLTHGVLQELGLVNLLAIGVIGTMGGCELKVSDLKDSFPKLAAITFFTFTLVLPAIGGLVIALTIYAPHLVPFLSDLPLNHRIAGALLLGILGIGMSPSATLALLQEVRARGRYTSLVLGTVVFADLVLVAMFLLSLALAKLLISPEGFSVVALGDALPHIAAEFGWAILLGLLVGIIFIAYLRLVGREVLLFSLGVVFVTSFVASRLHAETLLAFLVAGFVVQNFSSYGHTLIHAFEHIALPVFVIYFATQAATLDLVAVTVYLPLTLILVATRCTLFYIGIGIGTKVARVEDGYRRHLQMSFFSQGGVDLVLAAIIADNIPGWGVDVQTVTMATILFYVVGGPPFLARALDAVGESAAARERGAENLAERQRKSASPERAATFPAPAIGRESTLGARLRELHDLITDIASGVVEETVVARAKRRGELVGDLARTITTGLSAAGQLAGTPSKGGSFDVDEQRRRLITIDAALVTAARRWGGPDHSPLDTALLGRLLDTLNAAEPVSSMHRVVREPHLFEARGGGWQRLLRASRRTRRFAFGPGSRTVPTGRLWRYHVAFEVPAALWATLRPREAELWHLLLEHYRATRRDLEALATGGPELDPVGPIGPIGVPDDHIPHGDASTDPELPVPAPTLESRLAAASHRAAERERVLLDRIRESDARLERDLLLALSDAWQSFLVSVELAGTLELPSWRYRVSTKYDTAQAAKAELRERVDRDQQGAAGRRDAAAAIAHGHRLATWTRDAAQHSIEGLRTAIDEIVVQLDVAIGYCNTLRPPPIPTPQPDAPPSTVDSGELTKAGVELKRTIEDAIALLDRAARAFGARGPTDQRRDGARPVVRDIPLTLSPESDISLPPDPQREPRRTQLRLRAWLTQTLVREFTVASLDLDETAEAQLTRVGMSLHHARQVLDYHLTSASTTTLEVDQGLGERLASLLQKSREELESLVEQGRRGLGERVEQAATQGLDPLSAGRWDEVRRLLRRLDDRARPRDIVGRWLRDRKDVLLEGMRRRTGFVTGEIAALFDEGSTPAEAEAFRSMIVGPLSTMPEVYQRLFTSVPAESVGLIVERPELLELRAAVDRWLAGNPGAILLRGDRGAGKRTLVRQLVAERADQLDVRWVRLGPVLERESEVAGALARAAGWPSASRFVDVASGARRTAAFGSGERRLAVVVENSERLFRRNAEGLARIRAFLELVTATAGEALWVILMAEPAARVLSPVLELQARFASVIDVGPMDPLQLERVLSTRHRLSGYGLRIETHSPSAQEWLRGPGTAWRLLRGSHDAIYERLSLLSGGNVRQALRLWLAAARPDPVDPATVVVGPLTAMPTPLLDGVPLPSRMLLAALLLHGPLTRSDLRHVHSYGAVDLEAEITRLGHLGLVHVEHLRFGAGALEPLVSVQTRAVATLTEELRRCNLL